MLRSSRNNPTANNRNRFQNRLRFELLEERRLLAGVVSHWTADNTAADLMGAHNGTLSGGATYTAGKVGQAFSLDGINDTVLLAGTFGGGPEATIEAWVKSTGSTGDIQAIVSATESYFVHLQLGTYGNNVAYTNGTTVGLPNLPTTPQGEYRHIALSVKSGDSQLYVNGTLVGTSTVTYSTLRPTSNLRIGSGYLGGRYFKGEIDEVFYYDRALSGEEILADFNASVGSLQPSTSISHTTTTEGEAHFATSLDALVSQADNGGLDRSTGMTYGPDGNLYVGSLGTNEVLRYSGVTGAFLGAFVTSGSGGLSTPAVDGLSFRPDGKLYVASRDNSNVLRYDANTGAFLDVFIPKASGGLNQVKGMTFGPDGNLYISSSGTNQILRYRGSTGAFMGAFVAAGSGGLSGPRTLKFGPDGNLYISSTSNDSVLRYNGSTGAFVDAFIPTNRGGLSFPGDFLFHSGSLYVASQTNNQILRYDATTGAFLNAVDPANSNGADGPIGLLLGSDGNLLVGSFAGVLRYGASSDAVFSVNLSSPWPTPVTVDYSIANGTALAGSDFVSTSGTITFSPGQTAKTILVSILDDIVYEGNETFVVNLSNPVGGVVADSQGVGTIIDNEIPPTKFYVVNDGSPDRSYEYGEDGAAVENYEMDSGNTAPRGAASNVTGEMVWVVDNNKKVYVYDTNGGLLGSWTANSLASNADVQGITTNGTDVWIVDAKQDKVFKYTNAASKLSGSQNAASSFSLNGSNTSPKDLVTDGASIWVVNDSSTDKVFKYTTSGSLAGSWTITTSGATSPTGITLDPTNVAHIWIVDNGTDRVYQYNNATSLTSGSKSADSSWALDAANSNPQGIADPPPPSSVLNAAPASIVSNSAFMQAPIVSIVVPSTDLVAPLQSALAVTESVDEFMSKLASSLPVAPNSVSKAQSTPLLSRTRFAEDQSIDLALADEELNDSRHTIANDLFESTFR